ncbi:MAG TPA: tetratricopeptide repeat protein [Candidatus Polarisedimenticolaceae bacterium]
MTRRLLLAATLALALAHALVYRFLCDDAFISFRYARNLADGFGLVFNPGFERVEGYTNFLWVVILAAGDLVGIAPEHAANPLSLVLTVVLWGLVARGAVILGDEDRRTWAVAVAPLLLGATRSVAVWATSGLETRLYEVLVVGGTLAVASEVERRGARPWGAFLLALATLTRPDGLLVAACVLSCGALWALTKRTATFGSVALQAAVFWTLVGAHFLWRKGYYGEWLPNTYYAKVGGRAWWEMGFTYLGAFALEYGLWLVVPVAVVGAVFLVRRGRGHVPLLFAAAVVPHAIYVASIGGDHFEYRPLDAYFPFLFLLAGEGVRRLPWRAALTLALVFVVTWLPLRSHLGFVKEYWPGFPGQRPDHPVAGKFLEPFTPLGRLHRDLLRETTSRFVGIRQEEHRLFLRTVEDQGRYLRALVDDGVLPKDTHVATSCVGAIPYRSNLRTLDKLGLTDKVVARSTPSEWRILAHDKHATIDYARSIGVDLWSEDPVHLALPLGDGRISFHLDAAVAAGEEVWWAQLPGDRALLVRLPLGPDAARRKFPKLDLRSIRDPQALASLRAAIATAEAKGAGEDPDSLAGRVRAATVRAAQGDLDGAIAALRAIPEQDDADVAYNLGTLLAQAGRIDEAIPPLERATKARGDFSRSWFNLGLAYSKAGRAQDALPALARAAELEPDNPEIRFALGATALTLGRADIAQAQAAALEGMEGERGKQLAARLKAAESPLSN